MDVVKKTDLGLDDLGNATTGFALVDDGILSESRKKIVVQLAKQQIMLKGTGLSFDGDPYDLTTEEMLTAAKGTIESITLLSKDGSKVLATISGLSIFFQDLVVDLIEIDTENPPSIGDLLGSVDI
jgi:hypothetical protein